MAQVFARYRVLVLTAHELPEDQIAHAGTVLENHVEQDLENWVKDQNQYLKTQKIPFTLKLESF